MPGNDKIRITSDDLNDPKVDAELTHQRSVEPRSDSKRPGLPLAGKAYPPLKRYPAIATTHHATRLGALVYSAAFYAPMAGVVGGFLGWVITESLVRALGSSDGVVSSALRSSMYFAVAGSLLGAAFCSIESMVSGTYVRALEAGLLGLVLGALGGALAGGVGQALYGVVGASHGNVVLLLDTSGSMEGAPLAELKRAANGFLSAVSSPSVSIAIVTFSEDAVLLSGLSDHAGQLAGVVDSLQASGTTNMVAGLDTASRAVERSSGGKSILVFSDGMPTAAGNRTAEDMLAHELAVRGLTPETLQRMSQPDLEALQQELVSAVLGQLQAETIAVADRVRSAGIRVIAIGTGEADRGFLSRITGSASNVLFAEPGQISDMFQRSRELLFREADVATGSGLVSRMSVRGLCWGLAGAILVLGQGIVLRSFKKTRNAVIGGLIGGMLGGLSFDPMSVALGSGWASRMTALCFVGIATGLMLGLVESILKEAWLTVVAGHLVGKQFVIYRNPTTVGSSPKCEIYLFKDESVEARHAAIHSDGQNYYAEDCGTRTGTFINGRRITRQRLRSGDQIQVGMTTFGYSERAARTTEQYRHVPGKL